MSSEEDTTVPVFTPPSVEELDKAIPNYDISKLFASDWNGALYRARHESLARDVCVKILPPVAEEDQQSHFESFRNEARTMAKMTHPNIVKVYDFGQTDDGLVYFIMEYVEGSIFRRMLDWGQITMDHIFGWVTPICEALQYAHEQGVIHCDIRPSNILVTNDGEVKLANFGFSRLHGQGTGKTGATGRTTIATSVYAAPETHQQLFPLDYRADIYSLGVLLYELLTNQRPSGPYQPVSKLFEIDPEWDAIIKKAVSIDRQDRWSKATEISDGVTGIHARNKVPKFNFR